MPQSQQLTILLVEADPGHAFLVTENLREAGVTNRIEHLDDGVAVLDYLTHRPPGSLQRFIMLLDIRMPKMDGIQVLRRLKSDRNLAIISVIMLTTTDDMREVDLCYKLGCSVYLQKPVNYERFAEAIRRLGLFVSTLSVPVIAA